MKKIQITLCAAAVISALLPAYATEDTETIEVFGHSVASGYDTFGTQQWRINFDDDLTPSLSLVDRLEQLPGVGLTESAGLIQTVSIRGVGRQGVLMMLDGIPIVTNRRAGTGVHFVDPILLGEAQLLSGPSSAAYGAGALGGVINVTPRRLNGIEMGVQYEDNGASWRSHIGIGNGDHTLQFAHWNGHDSEAADGTQLNDHATRDSLLYVGEHQADWGRIEWLLAPARIRDMGRVANDPRVTSAPEETHLPWRVATQIGAFETALSFYQFDALTQIENPDNSQQRTKNEGTQWYWNAQYTTAFEHANWINGVSWSQRGDVRAEEISLASDGTETVSIALPEGEEETRSLFSALSLQWRDYRAHIGVRYSQQDQSAQGFADTDDSAVSFTTGHHYRVSDGFALSLAYSNGLRFAALTEKYYDGVTPRGRTIGNPDLKTEDARSVEFGFHWQYTAWSLDWQFYRQQIENYIERIRLDPPTPRRFTYQNLTEGTIKGSELQWRYRWSPQWSWQTTASAMRAESENGDPLAGIPAHHVRNAVSFDAGDCRYSVQWTWRATHERAGNDETKLASADYGDLAAQCRVNTHWQFGATISNANDDLYLLNADVTAGLARGRSLALSLVYR